MNMTTLPGYNLPDDNHTATLLASVIITTYFALNIIVGRLWVRCTLVRVVGWDDYMIGVAMALSIIGCSLVIREIYYGLGRHLFYVFKEVGPSGIQNGLRLGFEIQIVYVFAVACVKASVGLLLLRFTGSKAQAMFIRIVMGVTALYTVVGSGALAAACKPMLEKPEYAYDGKSHPAKLSAAVALANTVCNITTDFIFALLPVTLFWNLQVNRRTKASLWTVLALGIFAAVASLVKVYYLIIYRHQNLDFTWINAKVVVWTAVECNVGIIAATIPSLRPLFKVVLGASTSGTSDESSPPRPEPLQKENSTNHQARTESLGSVIAPWTNLRRVDNSIGGTIRRWMRVLTGRDFPEVVVFNDTYELGSINTRVAISAARPSSLKRCHPGKGKAETHVRFPLTPNGNVDRRSILITTEIDITFAPLEQTWSRPGEWGYR